MFARVLLVLTVSAISRNAYKWRREDCLPDARSRLRGAPAQGDGFMKKKTLLGMVDVVRINLNSLWTTAK